MKLITLIWALTIILSFNTEGLGDGPPGPPSEPNPQIIVNPTSVDFGSVIVGTATMTTTLTIKNTGNADLQIINISISGTNASEFSQTNNCTSPVAPQGTCTITVKFSPASTGSKSATLIISSNDPDESLLNVSLTGTGEAPGEDKKGVCFIATAAYGSYLDPHVKVLREFRDKYLLSDFKLQIAKFKIEIPNIIGKAFVAFYYKVSPPIADYIRQYESLRIATRFVLTPVVYGIKYPFSLGLILLVGVTASLRRRKQ
ncbi:MAG: choice-of-anchor D domain-containing protein [Nitrospirota bacterium]